MSAVANGERSCKSRLEVGGGNFTWIEALLKKHKEISTLAESIVTTEYKQERELDPRVTERVLKLLHMGCRVELYVDATKIDERYAGTRFRRIHFVCPHNGEDYKTQGTQKLVAGFFKAARLLQKKGDQIHLVMAQPRRQEAYRQYCAYDVVTASQANQYELVKMRQFSPRRFPGYVHEQTNIGQSAPAAERSFEFIFKKREKKATVVNDYWKDHDLGYYRSRWKDYGIDYGSPVSYFDGYASDSSSTYYDSDDEERVEVNRQVNKEIKGKEEATEGPLGIVWKTFDAADFPFNSSLDEHGKDQVLHAFLTENDEIIDNEKYIEQEPYDTTFPFKAGCAEEQKVEAIKLFLQNHKEFFDEEKWAEQIEAAESQT